MRHYVYLADDATMRTDAPQAGYQAHTAPDDPGVWIVAISDWYSVAEQDRWEQLPGVTCLHPEEHGSPTHPRLTSAFASWGTRPGQTRREALTHIRRAWPVLKL